MCFGSAPKAQRMAPPPPPPQLAKMPSAQAIRSDVESGNVAQGGGAAQSTLLTGPLGVETDDKKLGKKTLLGA